MKKLLFLAIYSSIVFATSCKKDDDNDTTASVDLYPAVTQTFGSRINLTSLSNYSNQPTPFYITKDNSGSNRITDAKATLGRVLFYDKNLSIDNSLACASCHKQRFAFSDTAIASNGVAGGVTGRHAMRLINTRYSNEIKFFWNERAASLEQQTTMPIQEHSEMGYSGQNGRPDLNALIAKLSAIQYYTELFTFVYGNSTITEQRLQDCLASFIRSIQSFDSKFDEGRTLAANDGVPFQNFTQQENLGKQLYLQPPQFNATGNRIGGGVGCQGCHRAPEFDIDPNSRNNGVINQISSAGTDLFNTRSPSLRDVVNEFGIPNGPFMHSAGFTTLQNAIAHYNNITIAPGNTNLDPRLMPGGNGQQLNMTQNEVDALVSFLKTLSGRNVYTDAKYSNPF